MWRVRVSGLELTAGGEFLARAVATRWGYAGFQDLIEW